MDSVGVLSDEKGSVGDQVRDVTNPPVLHSEAMHYYPPAPAQTVPTAVSNSKCEKKYQTILNFGANWISNVKKGQDRYNYLKTDEYMNGMRLVEKRVTLQLAYLYLIDTKKSISNFIDFLNEDEIVLITHSNSSESVVRLILTVNVIKHSSYDINSIASVNLTPKKQVVILGDANYLYNDPKDHVLQKLRDFVHQGGLLLSFNSAIALLDKVFPNKFQYLKGYKTVEKPIHTKLTIEPGEEEDIFNRYASKNRESEFLVLLQGVQRFSVIDPSVRILLTETAPSKNQPLVAKFHHGSGTVYHLLISHLASKVGDQGGSSFQGLSEMLDLPSKELAIETIKNLEKMDPPPTATIAAWKNALNCGYPSSINAAKAITLTLDVFFSILYKSLRSS